MKKILKTLAFLTSFIICCSFSSCSSQSSTDVQTTKGGYVETVLDLNSQVYSFTEIKLINNKITMFDSVFNNKYVVPNEGTKVENISDSFLKKLSNDANLVTVNACSDYGYFISKLNDHDAECNYSIFSADGNEAKVNVSGFIKTAEYSADGRLFAVNNSELCEIISTNNSIKPLMTIGDNIITMDIVGDNVIVVDEKGTHLYDFKNNNTADAPKALADFFDEYTGKEMYFDICEASDNAMLIACSSGIYRYVLNGNTVEQIIDGTSCSLGNPSLTLSSAYCCDNGDIIISFNEGKICRYTYDSELNNSEKITLKIYSLEKNNILSQIINGFASENQNIKIDYQIGMKNSMSYEDAMKEFTTQVLSGNAPDIVLLDGMDIDNYIDKNMLCDISSSSIIWNGQNSILDNIAKWNQKDGKLYSIACRFRIPAIGADSDELKNLKSFDDISYAVQNNRKQYNPEYPLMYFEKPEYVIKTGLIYEESSIINNNKIDSQQLEKLYESCTRIYNNDKNENAYVSYDNAGDESIFTDRMQNVITEDHTIAIGTINTFDFDLNILTSLDTIKPDSNAKFKYGTGNSDKVFIPECNLGIIDSGKSNENAEQFIAYALNQESQKINNNYGFPVNTDTLNWFYAKNKNDINNYYGYEMFSLDGKNYTMNIECMTNKEISEFDDFLRNLNAPFVINKATEQIIVNTGLKCIDGTLTPSEAADQAVSQLELRMKE